MTVSNCLPLDWRRAFVLAAWSATSMVFAPSGAWAQAATGPAAPPAAAAPSAAASASEASSSAPAAAPSAAAVPAAAAPSSPAASSAPSAPSASPAPAVAGGVARPHPESVERLQVADPFIELRTGPGRGYPVFHVVERSGWIRVELRRTDWYRVRSETSQGGVVGWVHRSQLLATLTEAGTGKTFRDLLLDDYLSRRVEFGAAWGKMRAEPMTKVFMGVRFGDTLGSELTFGQVQGDFAGSEFWHLALVSEPWSHQRLSPFMSFGFGRFRNVPNTSLVQAQTVNANLGSASFGLRWYLSERLVARLDWSLYSNFVSDQRSLELRATTLGVSFFF